MSKSHNMPGWRVGMLAANAEFVSWILKVKSNIDSGTFRAVQLAAAAAMDNDEDWHREHNVRRYAERRTLAESIMQALGCRFDRAQTGLFLWGRIPDALADAEELTERALHEADVFITPGGIFGQNGRRYVRISLCADEKPHVRGTCTNPKRVCVKPIRHFLFNFATQQTLKYGT